MLNYRVGVFCSHLEEMFKVTYTWLNTSLCSSLQRVLSTITTARCSAYSLAGCHNACMESFFFFSLLFRDASTFLVISHLWSLGVYQKAVYFYCYVVNVSFVKFTDFNFMILNLMNNGQMDRGNEIQPSICLDEWGKPRKNPSQVGRHRDSTWDLPNASLVRYHWATSLGESLFFMHSSWIYQRF